MSSAAGPLSISGTLVERKTGQSQGFFWLGLLALWYIGVYLCRKNLAVAAPLLREEWGLSKEAVGMVASISTLVYAFGQDRVGPVVDRSGGKPGLMWSMILVAVFGALGGLAPESIR